jgi:hypothetical protein
LLVRSIFPETNSGDGNMPSATPEELASAIVETINCRNPENRYLARQLCYVFTIEGLETYILQPGDPADLQTLIDSLRPTPHQPGAGRDARGAGHLESWSEEKS